MYGIKPIKLLKQINTNSENKINVCPELATGPTKILNSEWSWFDKNLKKTVNRFELNQKIQGIKNRPIHELNQLKGIKK